MRKTFKIVAFLEGSSYLLLLFIAVPIKYWGGDATWVRLLGMPHGILFILYILLALILKYPKSWNILGRRLNLQINIDNGPKWNFKDLSIILFASILPFGTFYVDRRYMKSSIISSKV